MVPPGKECETRNLPPRSLNGAPTPLAGTFTGSGWIEVVVKDTAACASHINGRLVCPDQVVSESPRLPVSDSIIRSVVALAEIPPGHCSTIESCIVSSVQDLPVHDALLLLKEAVIREPLSFDGSYLGARPTRIASVSQARLWCDTWPDPCLMVTPSQLPALLRNMHVTGAVVIKGRSNVELEAITVSYIPQGSSALISEDTAILRIENSTEVALNYFHYHGLESRKRATAAAINAQMWPNIVIRNAETVTLSNLNISGIISASSVVSVVNDANQPLSEFMMENSLLAGNTAVTGAGGAVSVSTLSGRDGVQRHLQVVNTTFANNTVSGGDGGGLAVTGAFDIASTDDCFACSTSALSWQIAMSGCQFLGNVAARQGGAVYVHGARVVVENSLFERNRAMCGGGAIDAGFVSVEVSASILRHNAVGPGSGEELPSAARCSNESNIGGGALRVHHCDLKGVSMKDSALEGNEAIAWFSPFHNSTTAADGGGLAASFCRVFLNGTSFHAHAASGAGGAVSIVNSPATSIIEDTSITSAVSSRAGAGMKISGSIVALRYLHCTDNAVLVPEEDEFPFDPYSAVGVGGCLALANGTSVKMQQSQVSRNYAAVGGGIHLECGVTLTTQGDLLSDNAAIHSGHAFYSECPHPLLSAAIRQASDTIMTPWEDPATPSAHAPLAAYTIGSGATAVVAVNAARGIFEGTISARALVALHLLDTHGRTLVEDSKTQCVASVAVDSLSTHPGSLPILCTRRGTALQRLPPLGSQRHLPTPPLWHFPAVSCPSH